MVGQSVPPHLGHPGTSGTSTTCCCHIKVVRGVVLVPNHAFPLIICLEVLICDCPFSPTIGLVSPPVPMEFVTSFPTIVFALIVSMDVVFTFLLRLKG